MIRDGEIFYAEGVRQPVEFVVDPRGGIYLYIERYRYHKTNRQRREARY